MFKFVHIADTHLDSAIASNDKDRELIIDEMQRAFKSAVNLCIDEKCHGFLIAGDLFDDERLSFKTEIMLRESFDKLSQHNISVFYCLGNHDSKSSKIRRPKLGENVHIFHYENPQAVQLKDADGNVTAIIVGVGYETPHVDYNLSEKFEKIKQAKNVPVVGMLHTSLDVGGDKVYSPCTYDDLAAFGYDYWALGHIHKTDAYGKDKPAVFPGCTCGRHFGETGKKGAYLVTLSGQGVSKYEFRELANIMWHDVETDGFEDCQNANDMLEICAKKIFDEIDDSKKNMIRIKMIGQCPMYSHLDDEAILDLQEGLSRRTGAAVTLVNNLSSFLNPQDYIDDKHLLSIALNMAKQVKGDEALKAEIMDIIEKEYKGLDGGNTEEYIDSLFDDIEYKLCDVMIKQEE